MAKTSSPDLESLMSDYTAFWNGDFSNREVVGDSVIVYHEAAPEGVVEGRQSVEAFIREFHSAFPDFQIVVDDWLHSDGVAMKEWTMTGTHEGEFNGVAPTGREMESRGMAKLLIEDSKVQEDRLYYNPQLMIEQLGLSED